MTAQSRALILGLTGPILQLIGIGWETVHILLHHYSEPLSARHIAFEPAILVILVGLAVSIVCIPTAIEVARAQPHELELPELGLPEDESGGRRTAEGLR